LRREHLAFGNRQSSARRADGDRITPTNVQHTTKTFIDQPFARARIRTTDSAGRLIQLVIP
jgi:hypothetical protein